MFIESCSVGGFDGHVMCRLLSAFKSKATKFLSRFMLSAVFSLWEQKYRHKMFLFMPHKEKAPLPESEKC